METKIALAALVLASPAVFALRGQPAPPILGQPQNCTGPTCTATKNSPIEPTGWSVSWGTLNDGKARASGDCKKCDECTISVTGDFTSTTQNPCGSVDHCQMTANFCCDGDFSVTLGEDCDGDACEGYVNVCTGASCATYDLTCPCDT